MPKVVKAFVIWLLKPTTKLTIVMTVATPATTPSRVSALRSFWVRMAFTANATFSVQGTLKSQSPRTHQSVLKASTTGRLEALRAGQ